MVAEAADEQAKTEATNGAHDAGSATWPSWPKVPIMNVTQDYPSQMDKDRLDIFWSKYKTKKELMFNQTCTCIYVASLVFNPAPLEKQSGSQDPAAVEKQKAG